MTGTVPPAGQRWRIVVADDSEDDRAELRRLLLQGSDRRLDFVETETAAQTLAVVFDPVTGPPDCLILDYFLPDADAPVVLTDLLASDGNSVCPVVVITGRLGEGLGGQALRAGAQDFIGKDWMSAPSLIRVVENTVTRWHMARELRASEARLHMLAQAVPHAVWMTDSNGSVVYVNERWLGYFGPDSARAGRRIDWQLAVHAVDLAEVLERASRANADGTPYQLDCRLRRADGEFRWHLVNAVPIRDASGDVSHWYGVNTDVHELRERDARLRLALQASRTGIWTWELATGAVSWTAEVHEISGVPEHAFEKTAAAFFAMVHDDDRARVEASVRTSIEELIPYQVEFRLVRPSGELRWVETQGLVTYDVDGAPLSILGSVTDTTERKRGEVALRAALADAEAAIQSRDRLASSISHDLKNPLNNFRVALSLLDAEQSDGNRAVLTKMNRQVTVMDRMVDELLDLAQIQSGRALALDLEETDLVALLRGLIAEYQKTAPRHRLELSVPIDTVIGHWDARRLDRVVNNLLSNAIKYSPGGSSVEVRVLKYWVDGQEWVALSVTDHGMGIPEADLAHVFQWYVRAENTRHSQIRGNGIGLAGARDIVTSHGGTIGVQSVQGEGSTFTVALPLRVNSIA